jgi:hypothetical protein
MERDQSMGDALRSTIEDARDLLRGEIALAAVELRLELDRMRTGALLFTAAAVSAVIAAGLMLMAVAWAVVAGLAWPAWAGFAIVACVALCGAVLLALAGRRYLGGPHMPHTIATMKENLAWIRARTP